MRDITDIIRKPRLTEKAMLLQEEANQVVFHVAKDANKIEIKDAVETLFKVKVDNVRTSMVHGKKRRVGRFSGRTSDWKKAVVTLAEGQKLDFLEQL